MLKHMLIIMDVVENISQDNKSVHKPKENQSRTFEFI